MAGHIQYEELQAQALAGVAPGYAGIKQGGAIDYFLRSPLSRPPLPSNKEPQNMCTICRHPSRTVIERDLLACPTVGTVAPHYNLPFHEAVKHKARLEARGRPAVRWNSCC